MGAARPRPARKAPRTSDAPRVGSAGGTNVVFQATVAEPEGAVAKRARRRPEADRPDAPEPQLRPQAVSAYIKGRAVEDN
jgi:hypothetical protein